MNYKILETFSSDFMNFLQSENRNPEMIKKFARPILFKNQYEGYEIEMCNGHKRINYFKGNKKQFFTEENTQIAPVFYSNKDQSIVDEHCILVTEGETDMFSVLPFNYSVLAIMGALMGKSLVDFSDNVKKEFPKSDYKFYVLFDNDSAGKKGSLTVASNLKKLYPRSSVFVLSWDTYNSSKDVRELINVNKVPLNNILDQCKHFEPKLDLINEILSSVNKGNDKEHPFKKLNLSNFEIFNDEYGRNFMSYKNSSISCSLGSAEAKSLLQKEYYEQTGKVLTKNREDELIRFVLMMKNSDNKSSEVSIRATSKDETYYYDLGRADSKLIAISKDGKKEVIEPTIKFKRPKTSLEVAYSPTEASELLKMLNSILNIQSPHDLILVIAFIIKSMLGKSGASPILIIEGEQGSSKTTTTKFLKRIIDPSSSDIKKFPSKIDDLHNYAINNYLLCFDNLSGINHQISDELCIISTSGSITKRELYTNDGEFTVNIQRPVILNGIEDIGERPDFLDRSITIHLPAIGPEKRKSETELRKKFESILPNIMGALFDLAHKVTRMINGQTYPNLPRMTEFAIIGIGIEKVLDYRSGFFVEAYHQGKERQNNQIISTNPLLITIKYFMADKPLYEGTPHNLFSCLKAIASAQNLHYGFPQTPACLTKALNRHQSSLRQMELTFQRGKDSSGRAIILQKLKKQPSQLSILSESESNFVNKNDSKDTKDGSITNINLGEI